MTTEEFSNEFDTLLNSHSIINQFGSTGSTADITVDEYEKSVFLSKAQEEVIIDLYNGNVYSGSSFEETEELRRYLNNLVKTYTTSDKKTGYTGLSDKSAFFELPSDLWFITYESVRLDDSRLGCKDGTEIVVVPVTQDNYYKIINNPFKRPGDRRAIRLDIEGSIAEIISEYEISRYLVRYMSKPTPIVLVDLPDNLSIDNVSVKTECKLNPVIHKVILEKAVKMAILSKNPSISK